MDIVVAFAYFLLGFLGGAATVIGLTIHYGKRALEKEKNKTNRASLEARMKRVKEITGEQIDLARSADGPQKNALDGKYKNGIIAQMKKLDEEKHEVLKSILSDGHDPELTTMDEAGVVTQMKLSEYMAHLGISIKPKQKPETKATRIGKFTVHRGGKDDGGNNTTH